MPIEVPPTVEDAARFEVAVAEWVKDCDVMSFESMDECREAYDKSGEFPVPEKLKPLWLLAARLIIHSDGDGNMDFDAPHLLAARIVNATAILLGEIDPNTATTPPPPA